MKKKFRSLYIIKLFQATGIVKPTLNIDQQFIYINTELGLDPSAKNLIVTFEHLDESHDSILLFIVRFIYIIFTDWVILYNDRVREI